jgi:arsenite-transporting ATPase
VYWHFISRELVQQILPAGSSIARSTVYKILEDESRVNLSKNLRTNMSDVKAFNNCMSVFWRQHEAEFSRFLTSKTGDSEKAADPEKTKVIIVTLAETTPVLEAANLQQDLRRAGIEPWAWVVNNSLAVALNAFRLFLKITVGEPRCSHL